MRRRGGRWEIGDRGEAESPRAYISALRETFPPFLCRRDPVRAFLIYSDALKKGEEERMNLELSRNGCEATAGPANSGNE